MHLRSLTARIRFAYLPSIITLGPFYLRHLRPDQLPQPPRKRVRFQLDVKRFDLVLANLPPLFLVLADMEQLVDWPLS